MPSGKHNITVEKGATFSLVLTWRDENKSLINLTGYTARMQIRERYDSEEPILELATGGDGITLGGSAGTITITIAADVTQEIEETEGVYDLELISGSTVTRLLQGKVTLSPEVTR